MRRFALAVCSDLTIGPSASGQRELVKKIINEFCPRFAPGGRLVYVAGRNERCAYFDAGYLRGLGVVVEGQGKMPDVVVHFTKRDWLFLIEAVTRHGPVGAKRLTELTSLFAGSESGLVFITALPNRRSLSKRLEGVAWGTNVWIATAPDHMIHFDRDCLLEPFSTSPS